MANDFSNFDTDFYGMKQFHNIMNSQGIISQEDIKKFLISNTEQMKNEPFGSAHYLDCNNGVSVVLTFSDKHIDEQTEFSPITNTDGDEIIASIRETGSAHMVSEWKSFGLDYALSTDMEEHEFDEISEIIYNNIVQIDPEEVDAPLVDREETIYDRIPDFKGSFEEWKDRINEDGKVNIEDINLKKVTASNGYTGDAVVFTLTDSITDANHDELDEHFTDLMPQSIIDFTNSDGICGFDYIVVGNHEFAFIAW